ncbi:MAG: hypothetical protein U9Q39_04195, partial [Pseudomonadota bacterium]|nr:hypothetical protein [Pseudomonadota bacterium]
MPGCGRGAGAVQYSASMQDFRFNKSEKLTRQRLRLHSIRLGTPAEIKRQQQLLDETMREIETLRTAIADPELFEALLYLLFVSLKIPAQDTASTVFGFLPKTGARGGGCGDGNGRGPPGSNSISIKEGFDPQISRRNFINGHLKQLELEGNSSPVLIDPDISRRDLFKLGGAVAGTGFLSALFPKFAFAGGRVSLTGTPGLIEARKRDKQHTIGIAASYYKDHTVKAYEKALAILNVGGNSSWKPHTPDHLKLQEPAYWVVL